MAVHDSATHRQQNTSDNQSQWRISTSLASKGLMMKRSRRDPSVNYIDENKLRVRTEQLAMLKRIIHDGRHEAEPQYVEAIKQWKPDISKEELQKRIKQFHDAVSEVQERERDSR